ncbi:B9 domain-containing protein 2 [Paragonimus westermani]|uniref:B9 domain-containing protein 2 n=1 Tax=Paragonimus westermani TaxID=34504 RepID=A0A5J4NWI5_9TREM|nr:B9 domain-containing protein 2 [Paragonimus westermani]
MAELHVIGQIDSAYGFPEKNLFCKWGINTGGAWRLIEGTAEGQTQVDCPQIGDKAYFCHPIDLHFATKGLQGWPKIHLQVWHYDWVGQNNLYGYGFSHIPTSPGHHNVEIAIWRPVGSLIDHISSTFVGGGPHLRKPDIVYNPSDRFFLQTESMGYVSVNLNVILRGFNKFGIEM